MRLYQAFRSDPHIFAWCCVGLHRVLEGFVGFYDHFFMGTHRALLHVMRRLTLFEGFQGCYKGCIGLYRVYRVL